MDTNIRKNEIVYAVIIISFFTLITMMASAHNYVVQSPCSDSTYFLYIGKALKDGAVMYKDVFDSKGPFLFFINYISMLIHETYGIVLIRFVFQLCFYTFAYKTLFLLTQKKYQIFLTLWVMMLMLSATLQGGNMSEEFALPLVMGGFYIFLQYVKEGKISFCKIVISGILCALTFLLRANLISMWLVYCAGIIVWLLWQKEIRKLLRYCLLFWLGVLIAHLPFLFYFAINGAIYDAIYGAFLFNMEYSQESNVVFSELLKWNFKFFARYHYEIWFVLFIYLSYKLIKAKKIIMRKKMFVFVYWTCLFVSIWFVNFSRFKYDHYFMGIIPILGLPLIYSLELLEKWIRKKLSVSVSIFLIIVILILINYPGSVYLKNNLIKYTFQKVELNVYEEVGEYIKQNTSDSDMIYSHRMWGIVYLTSGRNSVTKYFALTAANSDNFPDMEKTLFTDLENKKPPYIIIQEGRMFGEKLEKHLIEYLEVNYHLEKCFKNSSGDIYLFRINF